jgi:hypothetical protein
MISGSSAPRIRVVLVAAFGSLHDAEAAARFLTDRGVPTKAIGLSGGAADPRPGPGTIRRFLGYRSATRRDPVLTGEDQAVVAVPEPHVDDATLLLRRIGVDRLLVGNELP